MRLIYFESSERREPLEKMTPHDVAAGKSVEHFLHWLLRWEGPVLGWWSWVLGESRLSKQGDISQQAALSMASGSAHLQVPVSLYYRGKIPLG